MKIIHSSGKELKIETGTVLEMERTNPFFNDYGEQSIPIKLPPDKQNFETLGFPDNISGIHKMPQRTDGTIQDGIFHIACRQAILSANSKEGIDTSFYLNIGSFYEKMEKVQLSTVFKDKVINFDTIYSAMSFVRKLMVIPDHRFSCFPVLTESQDSGKIICLNKMVLPLKEDGYLSFYNEMEQTETVNEKKVSIPPGYYITPFVKVMHVLDEIFKYLGYVLEGNFFSETEPFKSMVFLNNNIDTIVDNKIRYEQLVPDCSISSVLDIFRNKFCCEFIPDEIHRTVRIELFNDVIERPVSQDLTKLLASPITINHGQAFKQLKLTCEKGPMITFQGGTDFVSATPDFLNKKLYEIKSAYPGAMISEPIGIIFREGYKGHFLTTEYVGSLNCDYYAGENLEDEEKQSPDVLVSIGFFLESGGYAPFVGTSRTMNSSIVWSSPSGAESTDDATQDKSELKPMLCFTVHRNSNTDIGTIYDCLLSEHLWDYALCYNGKNGLYEKFWRKYDDMLRNSMRPVTAKLMLSDLDKMNISAYEKVLINNQELLPDIIKYDIGKKDITECSFYTTRIYFPKSSAITNTELFKPSKYRWEVKKEASITDTYNYFEYNETPVAFYPTLPTEKEYKQGGRFYQKAYSGKFYNDSGYKNGILTVWLEPVLREV
ncbi:hypothetical protein [Parabacteroides sp. AM08-6]|uniref:hypothetical protein n=1 Tax=Parabacteroides sp. AM08-6 TaxID=2292053 RepID=UPI000F007847|nr:hypothetical protein [Parabacteroides sp. AM08-6]RHJ83555.1 hypothetical protein DW103_07470 [Parabacteroides sp. AM08-6]